MDKKYMILDKTKLVAKTLIKNIFDEAVLPIG